MLQGLVMRVVYQARYQPDDWSLITGKGGGGVQNGVGGGGGGGMLSFTSTKKGGGR